MPPWYHYITRKRTNKGPTFFLTKWDHHDIIMVVPLLLNTGDNMSRILIDLFNGNLEPHSHIEDNDSRCKNLRRLIERHHDTLSTELGKTERAVFEKYNDCINEYEYIITEKAFCDGFNLAVRIISEAMCSSEKQISD